MQVAGLGGLKTHKAGSANAAGLVLTAYPAIKRSAFDGAGCHHLSHQIVIPVAFDHHVASGAQLESFDQVVVHVGIHTRLLEGVDGCSRGTARNEPGFDVAQRRVRELAQWPEPVSVTPD